MITKPTAAVRKFVDHVEAQEIARSAGLKSSDDEAFKVEREALVQGVLTALGLTGPQLQAKLAIGRATWDRWRYATTIPQRSHLEALLRFAAEKETEVRQSPTELPPPLRMLASSPFSWGRIKLVYTVYPWRNAVFKFSKPFVHEDTALEMLLLAFRGCQISYIMPGASSWCPKFVQIAKEAIGKTDTARALTKICIVDVSDAQAAIGLEYGLFNYGAEDEDESAGYVWLGKQDSTSDKPPPVSERDVYRPVGPRDDNVYGELREVYFKCLDKAFETIISREKLNFWSANDGDENLLKIPVINFDSPNKVIYYG